MKINARQIAAVLALPGPERFKHFVKVIVDWEEAWGLYQDGWALAANDDGTEAFPLWPAREYAQLCAEREWSGYEPKRIPLEELVNILLPKLEKDGVLPGIFYTPADKGITPSIDELQAAIKAEAARY